MLFGEKRRGIARWRRPTRLRRRGGCVTSSWWRACSAGTTAARWPRSRWVTVFAWHRRRHGA